MTTKSSLLDSSLRIPLGEPPEAPQRPSAVKAMTSLNLDMQSQLETEWCWAAVSASIAAFYDPASPFTQCGVVNTELGQTSCCQDGGSSSCNQPWYLDRALTLVGHLATDFEKEPDASGISAELNGGKPIGVSINWTGGGGHFVCVDGYDPSQDLVEVKDPMFGNTTMPRSQFPASYQGGGTWAWTYLTTKAPKAR